MQDEIINLKDATQYDLDELRKVLEDLDEPIFAGTEALTVRPNGWATLIRESKGWGGGGDSDIATISLWDFINKYERV